jgi:hypothetical protein
MAIYRGTIPRRDTVPDDPQDKKPTPSGGVSVRSSVLRRDGKRSIPYAAPPSRDVWWEKPTPKNQPEQLGTGYGKKEVPFHTEQVGKDTYRPTPGLGEPGYNTGEQGAQSPSKAINAVQSEQSAEKVVAEGSWLPKNWAEARPQIIWGVLVLGCGLELIISLLDGHFGRAFLALIGLLGLAAIVIHGEQFKQKLLSINSNWIVAAFSLFLAVLIFSPFVEEKRWPLSSWFPTSGVAPVVIHDPPSAADIAKAAGPLIEKSVADSKKEFDDLRDHFALLQNALDDMTKQRDAAEAEAQRLRGELGARVAQQIPAMTGPIKWNLNGQFLVTSGGGPSAIINNVMLSGVSNAPVRIKEAYAISGITGHRQELMANVQHQGYYPVDKVDIPADAPIFLTLVWQPPLSIPNFLDQWGKFSVTVIYDDTTFNHGFSEEFIRDQLRQVFPDAVGPHVTPRIDK